MKTVLEVLRNNKPYVGSQTFWPDQPDLLGGVFRALGRAATSPMPHLRLALGMSLLLLGLLAMRIEFVVCSHLRVLRGQLRTSFRVP